MLAPAWIRRQSVQARVARRTQALLADYARGGTDLDARDAMPGGWVVGQESAVSRVAVEDVRHEFPLWSIGTPVDEADDETTGGGSLGFGGDDHLGRARGGPSGSAAVLSGSPPGRLGGLIARTAARRGLRIDPGRRGAAAVGMAALVAILVAGTWVLADRPHASAVTSVASGATTAAAPNTSGAPKGTPSAAGGASASVSGSATTSVVVDVVGRVAHPGVYRLPAGSRIDDALRAAGGARTGVDLSTLNLAALISDGQQIAVGVAGAPDGEGAAAGSGSSTTGASLVNLNTATATQFDSLPGVGPVLAQRLVAWRQQHGQFTSIDQLREVSGIGPAKFDDLRSLVTL